MPNINFIASAGTGKTTTLVEILSKKVLEEKLNLKNILVLTFTEKAANELKDKITSKLEELLKDDKLENEKKDFIYKQLLHIDGSYIGTFHSNFRKFLIKHPLESKIDKSYNVLSEDETEAFLNISLEKWIEEDYTKNKEDWNNIITDFKSEENLKSVFFGLYKKRYKLKNLNLKGNIIVDKVLEFIKYVENQKQIEKVYDFDDILNKTLELLNNNQKIKEEIKNSFRYIFIDEFQDTDEIQVRIIKEISNNNILVFGDPKQCIYQWRNANLDVYFSFLDENNFEDNYLGTNYRSFKKIVELSNELLKNPKFLTHIEEKFKKQVEHHKKQEGSVKLIRYEPQDKETSIQDEAKITVKLIKELIDENFQYSDIMVLFRENRHIKVFSEVFSQYSIPFNSSAEVNLFDTKEVRTVLDILKFIDYPDRKIELIKILKSPLFSISNEELYEKKDNLSIESVNSKNAEVLKKLINEKHDLTVEEVIDVVYSETDILESFSLYYSNTKFMENLKNLKLLSKEKTMENMSLRDFIIFTQTGYVPVKTNIENAVRLLTIHKAKGLESKVVIIPLMSLNLNKTNNSDKIIDILNNKLYLHIGSVKIGDENEYKTKLKSNQLAELERLFYVAITRPQEKLILISCDKDKYTENEIKFYDFIKDYTNLFENVNLNLKEINLEKSNFENSLSIEDLKKEYDYLKDLDTQRENILKEALNDVRFKSVSQIIEENQKEENYLSTLEKSENISLYVGTFIHNVLEIVDFKNFTEENIETTVGSLKDTLPENVREKVIERSMKILKNLINTDFIEHMKSVNILFRELPFTIYENDVFIEGRIDVIYEKDGKVFVMDYKTNVYETDTEKQKILDTYEKQKEYYLKAVKKIFPDKDVEFKLGLLWKGEVV